jgi:lipopolysaccharide/colanic/teichoic acid biosynthesis glycosyltransferase
VRLGKRLVDILVSTSALILLSPFLAIVALLILVFDGRPILFRHPRPGLDERVFELVKFRTMPTVEPPMSSVSPTPLGHWLRRYSVDELPELWNVLKGDMSLIGPRPLLIDYLPGYSPEEKRRHSIRPGITGWAQVRGRNLLTLREKVALDVWYIENQSMWLDCRIAFLSVGAVLSSRGIDPETGGESDKAASNE